MTTVVAILTFGIMVLGGIVHLFIARRRKPGSAARARIENAWTRVLATENPVLKIVEADKVLDLALGQLGYKGTLGEKLKAAGPRFSNLNAVWAAHKLRNALVHDLHRSASATDISSALAGFRQGLKDLGF